MNTPESIGLQALLTELSDPATTVERAETLMRSLDGLEAVALPAVFRWLHDASDEPSIHAATRLMVRWKESVAAQALPPALRALIREPAVADLNKIAAAGVLAVLGQPLHDADLAGYLRDPVAVKHAALRRLLDTTQGRLAIANTLDPLAARPPEAILPLLDDLIELGDPAGARLLVPMAHHADPDVAVSAVAALDAIGAQAAAPALALLAAHHPAPGVRAQAALTVERLRARGVVEGHPVEGSNARVVHLPNERSVWLLSAPNPLARDERELLTLHVDPGVGVVESAVMERVEATAMAAIEARLGASDVAVEAVGLAQAIDALVEVTIRTLDGATPEAPLGWTTWRELLAPLV